MSTLDKGVLSAAAYGRKIHQSLGFLVPYAISIAMLPFFCEMVDRDRKEELGAMITKSSRLLILFCSPLAALLVVLSLPISRIIFQGGHYDYNDCLIASTANACYSLVLPFYALEYVLMQAFFANRKMVSITLIGMFFSTLSMLVCYVCVIRLGMTGTSAVAAVALAYTGTRMLKVFALGGVMRCFLPVFPAGETVGFLFRALLVAVATGCSAMGVRALYERLVQIPAEGGRMMLLPKIAPDIFLSGLAGTVVAIASAWFFCRADSEQIVVWFKEKLRRRRGAD
jgi:peptidoglycan biosynthesis protein MviN/MurJ (putative lipid II flippase)